nr:hypothetical protein [Tanacetum cinerariifolium]
MARLVFCDYHNMISILEKYEHNTDFHQIVDFVEASHLRIETTDEETKILATVDGKPKTISESSIRRNLKLKDEAGISSLLDAELFENLTLMGYNILPNQKFSFQKGQFSHQWKYLIHTIMQYIRRARIAQSSALSPVENEPASPIRDDNQDATIKGRRLETGEEADIERSTEKGSDDTKEMVNVLTSLDAANVLSSEVQVSVPPAAEVATVSVPPATISVPTCSDVVPTASPIFTTFTVTTPYSKRKGKEKMVESETPKKKKLQEQIDVQMARQLEEEMEKDS